MSERRIFLAVFFILAAAQVVPIWAVRLHPIPDLSNTLAAATIWSHLHDPKWGFERYYSLSLGWTPYWGYHVLVHAFAWILDVDRANRVVLSLVVVGLPAGMTLLARRFGRSEWLALFAFPLAWNKEFSLGFVTFAVAFTLLPFVLAAFDWFCEKPTWGRALLASAGGAAVFFSHFLPWVMYLACAGLVGLLHQGLTRRSFFQRLGVWAAPALVGVLVMRAGSGNHMGAFSHGVAFAWRPALGELTNIQEWVLDLWKGHEDEALCALLLGSWVALFAVAKRTRPRLHDLRAEAGFLVGMVGYLFGPRSLLRPVYWWGINVRFAPLAMLFLALCIPGRFDGWRRWLFAPVAAAALAFAIGVTVHWQRVNQFLAGFDELASRPSVNERVLTMAFPPWNEPTMNTNFAQSAHAYRQATYGGYQSDNFDDGFPTRYKQRFPSTPWNRPDYFKWERYARYYDWLLVFQAPGGLLSGHPEAQLAGRAGRWSLWRLPGPRVDVPPEAAYPSGWATDPNWSPPPSLPSPTPQL